MCGKVFNKAKLTPHIKQVHTEVAKSVECPKCGKRFKEARHVRKHMKDVHAKENKCGDCPKTFSKLRYLKIHIKNEHNTNDGIQKREESLEDLRESNSMQSDALDLSISVTSNPGDGLAFVEIKEEAMNLVKEEELDGDQGDSSELKSDDKPGGIQTTDNQSQGNNPNQSEYSAAEESLVYCCQECGKAYGRKDVLRKHVRTKHGNSGTEDSLMLKCTACEKTYGRKDCLRKHYKRKHIDIGRKYESFGCDQCDKIFSSRDKLTRHKIQHTASDGKPFGCEDCPERFTRKDAMVRHMKRQHSCL